MGQIVRRNQQLGNGMMVLAEQLVVNVHQLALAHCRRGLLGGDILRPVSQSQLAHAHANGAGGNQNQLVPGVADITHGLAQGLHPPDVQLPGGVGQCGCSDFYNDTHRHSSAP